MTEILEYWPDVPVGQARAFAEKILATTEDEQVRENMRTFLAELEALEQVWAQGYR